MNPHIKTLQAGLGIASDGILGPITERTILKAAQEGRLVLSEIPTPLVSGAVTDLPWMTEAKRILGRHEGRDNGWLRSWLKSDGKTLGDPAKLPWCGDFVETCIRLALPSEPFPGALGVNPYWARNWLGLGGAIAPTYGAVLVFERGPSSGHVGFAVGQDATTFFVLGGNQSDSVTVARIAKTRLLGARWPSTFARPDIPRLAPMVSGGPISTNEA
jgi:uncharacterized protein (TIGR02594 family)